MSSAPEVVVLAGGTGGAKLARGMLDVVGPDRLTVIANTGDDIEIYGAYVSPDPDLIAFWLADRIDERGWGLRGDTFAVMEGLRELGAEVWFNLGDRDLAWCLERRRLLSAGLSATAAGARLTAALGVAARVLPMSDEAVRTWVRDAEGWHPFQEFMIRRGGAGPVLGLEFRGVAQARATADITAALGNAGAIIIGPSNPLISIGPILEVGGMREALRGARAPVIAVSPIVQGAVVKGPTGAFLDFAGLDLSAAGVARAYDGLLDGVVADEPLAAPGELAVLQIDTRMATAEARRRVAEQTLAFARGLRGGGPVS